MYLYNGALLASACSLFGVVFIQYSKLAFNVGLMWIILCSMASWLVIAAIAIRGTGLKNSRSIILHSVFKLLGMAVTVIGYLALFSLTYGIIGAIDEDVKIPSIELIDVYRNFISPLTVLFNEYFDDIIVGLVTTGIGGVIATVFRK